MGNKRLEAEIAQIIGEPIVESIFVKAKGETETIKGLVASKVLGAAFGGAVSGAVSGALKGSEQVTQEQLQLHPEMILAISSTQVVLFELKIGFIRNSIGQLILKIPSWSITKFETEKTNSSLARGLLIEVQNNRKYEVEVPLGNLPRLRQIVEVFYQTQAQFNLMPR